MFKVAKRRRSKTTSVRSSNGSVASTGAKSAVSGVSSDGSSVTTTAAGAAAAAAANAKPLKSCLRKAAAEAAGGGGVSDGNSLLSASIHEVTSQSQEGDSSVHSLRSSVRSLESGTGQQPTTPSVQSGNSSVNSRQNSEQSIASGTTTKTTLSVNNNGAAGGTTSSVASKATGGSLASNGSCSVCALKGGAATNNAAVANPATTPAAVKRKKGVRWKLVQVREYERVIGDNPSCSNGAPISIGWNCVKEHKHKLDEFERARLPYRRTQHDLVLTRQEREEKLIEWNHSFPEIIESIRANIRAKHQRRRTVNSIGTYDRWEEAMESASRKLKRTLLLQRRKDPEYFRQLEQLTAQAQRLAAAKQQELLQQHAAQYGGGVTVNSSSGGHQQQQQHHIQQQLRQQQQQNSDRPPQAPRHYPTPHDITVVETIPEKPMRLPSPQHSPKIMPVPHNIGGVTGNEDHHHSSSSSSKTPTTKNNTIQTNKPNDDDGGGGHNENRNYSNNNEGRGDRNAVVMMTTQQGNQHQYHHHQPQHQNYNRGEQQQQYHENGHHHHHHHQREQSRDYNDLLRESSEPPRKLYDHDYYDSISELGSPSAIVPVTEIDFEDDFRDLISSHHQNDDHDSLDDLDDEDGDTFGDLISTDYRSRYTSSQQQQLLQQQQKLHMQHMPTISIDTSALGEPVMDPNFGILYPIPMNALPPGMSLPNIQPMPLSCGFDYNNPQHQQRHNSPSASVDYSDYRGGGGGDGPSCASVDYNNYIGNGGGGGGGAGSLPLSSASATSPITTESAVAAYWLEHQEQQQQIIRQNQQQQQQQHETLKMLDAYGCTEGGMDCPGIRRTFDSQTHVVISEDGGPIDYSVYDWPAGGGRNSPEDQQWENGFTMQPPPHSNSIISKWE